MIDSIGERHSLVLEKENKQLCWAAFFRHVLKVQWELWNWRVFYPFLAMSHTNCDGCQCDISHFTEIIPTKSSFNWLYLFRLLSVTCHNTRCVMFVCVSHISECQQLFYQLWIFQFPRRFYRFNRSTWGAVLTHIINILPTVVAGSYEIKIHHEPYGLRCVH